jgi:hypothetical protein
VTRYSRATSGRSSSNCPEPSCTSLLHFTPNPIDNQRPPTALSPCICAASPPTDLDSGFNGCHGQSTATTLRFSPPCARRHSGLSMAGTRRRCANLFQVKQCCRWCKVRWHPGTNSWLKSRKDWSKHNSSTRSSMTPSIVRWNSQWIIQYFLPYYWPNYLSTGSNVSRIT